MASELATVTLELLAAVSAVMKAVSYAPKTLAVSTGGASYKAASEVDVLAALRPAMIEQGLMVFPVQIASCEVSELHGKTRDGYERTTHRVDLQVIYRLYHVSGGYIDMPHCGRGDDSGDKSYGKAETYAFKYALRQAFALPTGDDPDKDASPAPEEAPRKAAPKVKKLEPYDASKENYNVPPPMPAPDKPLRLVTIEAGSDKPTDKGKARYSFKLEGIGWASTFDTGIVERAGLGDEPARFKGQVYMHLIQKGEYWNFDAIQLKPPLDPGASYPDDALEALAIATGWDPPSEGD